MYSCLAQFICNIFVVYIFVIYSCLAQVSQLVPKGRIRFWDKFKLVHLGKWETVSCVLDSIAASLFENNWLSWRIVSDDKTQITTLILGLLRVKGLAETNCQGYHLSPGTLQLTILWTSNHPHPASHQGCFWGEEFSMKWCFFYPGGGSRGKGNQEDVFWCGPNSKSLAVRIRNSFKELTFHQFDAHQKQPDDHYLCESTSNKPSSHHKNLERVMPHIQVFWSYLVISNKIFHLQILKYFKPGHVHHQQGSLCMHEIPEALETLEAPPQSLAYQRQDHHRTCSSYCFDRVEMRKSQENIPSSF